MLQISIKLYLDTSVAKKAKVDLIDGKKIIDSVISDSPLKSIDKIIKKNNLKLNDIEEFDYNHGPGSFTGLRVGAAVINTLNWTMNKNAKSKDIKYQDR